MSTKAPETPPVAGAAPPGAGALKEPVHLVALGLGAGLVPRAPGTAGSLLGLAPAWLVSDWPLVWQAGLIAVLAAAGIWICGESARRLGRHDHPAIVYDEIVGIMAAAMAVPAHASGWPLLAWLLLAFVLFRVFDIFKPWPIREMDHRLGGGAGIMLDDLMAAVYAAVCLLAASFVFPGP